MVLLALRIIGGRKWSLLNAFLVLRQAIELGAFCTWRFFLKCFSKVGGVMRREAEGKNIGTFKIFGS